MVFSVDDSFTDTINQIRGIETKNTERYARGGGDSNALLIDNSNKIGSDKTLVLSGDDTDSQLKIVKQIEDDTLPLTEMKNKLDDVAKMESSNEVANFRLMSGLIEDDTKEVKENLLKLDSLGVANISELITSEELSKSFKGQIDITQLVDIFINILNSMTPYALKGIIEDVAKVISITIENAITKLKLQQAKLRIIKIIGAKVYVLMFKIALWKVSDKKGFKFIITFGKDKQTVQLDVLAASLYIDHADYTNEKCLLIAEKMRNPLLKDKFAIIKQKSDFRKILNNI